MKKECLICGEAFDCRNQAKTCPVCRTAGKRICGHCGKVFVTTSKTRYVCKDCDAVRAEKSRRVKGDCPVEKKPHTEKKPVQRQCVVCEKMAREPHNPQRLAEMAKEAREMGMSYGKYSAMKRGLLKV